MTIQINQGRACHSSNYSSRGGSAIKYIVIHYTAGNGDTAQNNCTYSSGANRGASAHYFVGEDGIYQSVPDNMRAWHCGGTSVYKHADCRNANSIAIEMCSRKNSSGEYYLVNSVVEQAAELAKYLMKKYNIPAANVIRHYDVWAKECPAPFVKHPEQWTAFKELLTKGDDAMTSEEKVEFSALKTQVALMSNKVDELKNKVEGAMIYNYIDNNMPDWAKPTIQKLVGRGILQGTGENGELGLTDELLRLLVINDRAGVYGN